MEEGFQEGTAVYIQLLLDETYYNQIMYYGHLQSSTNRYPQLTSQLVNNRSTLHQQSVSLVLTDSYSNYASIKN